MDKKKQTPATSELRSEWDERMGTRLEASFRLFHFSLGKKQYKTKAYVCLTLQFHLRKLRQI